MLLKAFRGRKAIKIPAGCGFDSNIYDIFLSANVPTVLCIMSWILHLIMVDIIIKWTGIYTAKNISIPEVMMVQDWNTPLFLREPQSHASILLKFRSGI